jgi:hypothetical protein
MVHSSMIPVVNPIWWRVARYPFRWRDGMSLPWRPISVVICSIYGRESARLWVFHTQVTNLRKSVGRIVSCGSCVGLKTPPSLHWRALRRTVRSIVLG